MLIYTGCKEHFSCVNARGREHGLTVRNREWGVHPIVCTARFSYGDSAQMRAAGRPIRKQSTARKPCITAWDINLSITGAARLKMVKPGEHGELKAISRTNTMNSHPRLYPLVF